MLGVEFTALLVPVYLPFRQIGLHRLLHEQAPPGRSFPVEVLSRIPMPQSFVLGELGISLPILWKFHLGFSTWVCEHGRSWTVADIVRRKTIFV